MADRHLITSALPYVSGVKHLGNLAGSLLPSDVHARFLRQAGNEVLFICAKDEHGTSVERATDLPVAEFCQRLHDLQADIYRRFKLSFDHFGRTSSALNRDLIQNLYCRLGADRGAGHPAIILASRRAISAGPLLDRDMPALR